MSRGRTHTLRHIFYLCLPAIILNWLIDLHLYMCLYAMGLPGGSDGKASACNAEDLGSIPGSERSPGEGNGNPLQYSCLENSRDGGTW